MAEIKNSFFQGKMNKDLDERLIPNGQYRDALNIEVSTSEADDVGTVQNVKGNTLVSANTVPTGSSIVGEITDEKNNCIYYFVSGPETLVDDFDSTDTQPTVCKDLILKYDNSSVTNVFTDIYRYLVSGDNVTLDVSNKTIAFPNTDAYKDSLATNMYVSIFDTSGTNYIWNNRIINVTTSTITLENEIDDLDGVTINASIIIHISHKNEKRALNFDPNYYVTGLNVVEDFLMWTDNNSEPKKISISRSIAGTTDANTPTKLYIDGSANYPLTTDKVADETHLTVIRKSPINCVTLKVESTRTGITNKVTDTINTTDITQGDSIDVSISTGDTHNFLPNDILHLDTGTPDEETFQIKLKIISLVSDSGFIAKVLYNSTTGTGAYNIFVSNKEQTLYKDKFSFFATRWKYVDGEYSTFSPFSEAAFLPSEFKYDTEEAFNIGMKNKVKQVEITNIIPSDIPEDVVQVDILYTESNSPEVYKVESIRKDSNNDSYWTDNSYVITKENIYSLLEEKQLLRQWDNVPKKALGQEIVGNRLVYANYEQNYDLEDQNVNIEAYIDNRVFAGPELLPNPYLSENFDGWTTPQPLKYIHHNTKTENNRTPGYIQVVGDTAAVKFHTDSTFTSVESDEKYYYSFVITNWAGSSGSALQGPALMSGNEVTGKYANWARIITGNGYYSGVLHVNADRNTGPSFFQNPTVRQYMFQVLNTGFTCHISNFSLKKILPNNKKSVKSLRNYKLGVVYADEYGRETPVLTGKSASVSVSKQDSASFNCIKARIQSDAPDWATHFKYFVKETSSGYHNLAMDRIYKSGDGGYWLSFPSAERNKVDEEDFLILKKAHDSGLAVTDADAIYKVLDISANAPDFIKQTRVSLGVGGSSSDINTDLFTDAAGLPVIEGTEIHFEKNEWIDVEQNPDLLDIQKDLVFQFKDNNNQVSKIYKVDSITEIEVTGKDYYRLVIEGGFLEEDLNWALDGAIFATGVVIEIFSSEIKNRPEFDGRFFVKVNADTYITNHVFNNSTNAFLNRIIANISSFYKQDSVSVEDLLKDYQDKPEQKLRQDYAAAANATNVMAINDTESIGSFDDLTSSAFFTTNSTGPFGTTLAVNDTLYHEARPWTDCGDDGGSGTNIYRVLTTPMAFTMAHYEFETGQNDFNQSTIGGISDNIVGVSQNSRITSSGTTPGRLKHAAFSYSYGLFQKQSGSSFALYGSIGAYMKFMRIFKFGVGTDNGLGVAGEYGSNWFIDDMSYIGTQPNNDYDPDNGEYRLYHRAMHYQYSSGPTLEMATNDAYSFGNNIAPAKNDFERVGRGIYVATQDDVDADSFHELNAFYMQISFGAIDNDISAANYADATTWQNNGWTSSNSSFVKMVDNIKTGAKFRFDADASQEEFEILDFKKVQRYNHTPFPGDDRSYYIYSLNNSATNIEQRTWADIRDAVPGGATPIKFRAKSNHTNANSDFILYTTSSGGNHVTQESITDEETRFGRGTNRRLTYIIKLDKLPDASTFVPINNAGGTVTGKMDGDTSQVISFIGDIESSQTQVTTELPAIFETEPKQTEGLDVYYEASDFYDIKRHGAVQDLSYYNCYSFQNGVESTAAKDVFNKPTLGKGIVASTTLEEVYKQDNRGSGLIFSGIYNSTSNVNNLNQFIQAERITKDVNPTYGTIQKLYTKDSNLLVLCEDKILKILANKDAVFNADGNTQLTANKNVLGQTIPYVGEFGISKDPRSFTAQSHRAYFTDKQRGVVLRLSMDGLTTISQYGLADFFKDNLATSTALIGSYDTRKNEYNIKVDGATDYIVSFNENIKGWSSFKSFTEMEAGISLNNNYYTFKNGDLWKHHSNETRCNFYGNQYYPEVTVVLNTNPYVNKRFKTLNYEGTQSKVDLLDVVGSNSDAQVYNTTQKFGWYVDDVQTPTQTGTINEFLEKDNKWYNYIKGQEETASNLDASNFNVQGLGIIQATSASS